MARISKSAQRIYLDYAASTPVDSRVWKVMQPYFTRSFGNPGSLHSFGQEAIAAVDDARECVADLMGADFRNIIFTGSATEANNLALRGAVAGAKARVREPKIVVSAAEHESVLETAKQLFEEGVEVVKIPVNGEGRVDPADVESALDERTVLVSVMYANNETGTVQDVRRIGEAVRRFRESRRTRYPLFHTDAVQAFQYLDCRPADLSADLMTLSAHKIYGPKGVGVLYAADISMLHPVVFGGGQEFGLRSGTENVALVAGAAEAFRLADVAREKEARRVAALASRFWADLKRFGKKLELNGVDIKGDRLPNVLNIHFPGILAEHLLTELDLAGVAASSGSACASRSPAPSHVLTAMGLAESRIRQSIRFSLGRTTTPAQLRRVLKLLKKILEKNES